MTFPQVYDPYGSVATSSGSSSSSYGFTNEYQNSYIKLIYLRSRMYSPLTGRFLTKDSWQGDYNRPLSLNRWNYTEGNPVNYTDPTGLSPLCHDEDSISINFSGFTYNRCLRYGRGITASKGLLVNLRSAPWNKYISKQAPSTMVLPVRHPLNLFEEFGACTDLDKMRKFFTSGGFFDWELNARNITAEIGNVIAAGKEYALRDAIGIAYSPYNRILWNKSVPPYQRYDPYLYKGIKGDPFFDFKALLLSGSAYGISTRPYTAWGGDYLGTSKENIYEIALIVAYGVAKRYFVDTSFGATEYNHRIKPEYPGGMVCGDAGPVFFHKDPSIAGVERFGFSTEELWAQQGWDKKPADLTPASCTR